MKKNRFKDRDVPIVVISFAEPRRLVPYQEYHQWPFVLLADPERKAYGYFSLTRLSWLQVFSLDTLKLYFHLLRSGKKIQNYGKDDYFQAGGDFLIDHRGNILFAYRSYDPSDRPSAARLLREIDEIGNRS